MCFTSSQNVRTFSKWNDACISPKTKKPDQDQATSTSASEITLYFSKWLITIKRPRNNRRKTKINKLTSKRRTSTLKSCQAVSCVILWVVLLFGFVLSLSVCRVPSTDRSTRVTKNKKIPREWKKKRKKYEYVPASSFELNRFSLVLCAFCAIAWSSSHHRVCVCVRTKQQSDEWMYESKKKSSSPLPPPYVKHEFIQNIVEWYQKHDTSDRKYISDYVHDGDGDDDNAQLTECKSTVSKWKGNEQWQ